MPPRKSFRLDRMQILAELAGDPERCAPVIHIAGSKGKGSIAAMIASILEADGKKAARYMSPHVSDFRERICLGNSFFDEDIYCAAGDELRNMAENIIPAKNISLFDSACDEGEPLTFFELLTMLFFLCARIKCCDIMVLETGMGGRLDCTNIVDPLVSVITLIELEHTSILGGSIEAIANEKAGIIKQGRPLFLARQKPQAYRVFNERALERNSPLYYFPEIASAENINVHKNGTDFSMSLKLLSASEVVYFSQLSIPIPGKLQAENAALAAAALRFVFPQLGSEAVKDGLKNVKLPARFEKITCGSDIIVDGAHTPESIKFCTETFCTLYGSRGILLFGCAADKNAEAMAKVLLPHFSQIIITAPGNFKISNPEKVYKAFNSEKAILISDTSRAVQRALQEGKEKKEPVLVTGSFYLAEEVRKIIQVG